MTTPDADRLATLEAHVAALTALVRGDAVAAPRAAGDLPPHVAAGELVESAWGNAVVDALTVDRTNGRDVAWSIPQVSAGAAGTYDLTPVVGGPAATLTYPATITLVMAFAHGSTTTGAGQGRAELFRYKDNTALFLGGVPNQQGVWATTPLAWVYDVAPGQAWGAKARITIEIPGGSYSVTGTGFYRIQRTA